MKSPVDELEAKGKAAKAASRRMAYLLADVKNRALHNITDDLLAKKSEILDANQIDYKAAEASGMSAAMLDRLMLSESRLEAIAQDVLAVAALPPPAHPEPSTQGGWNLASGGQARHHSCLMPHLLCNQFD